MMWRRSCRGSEACFSAFSSSPVVLAFAVPAALVALASGRKTLGGIGGSSDVRGLPCLKTSSALVARAGVVGLATTSAAASLTARGDHIQYLMPCVQECLA